MSNKISSILLIIAFSYVSISCQSKSTQIEFLKINEGVASFKVVNNTNEDIYSIGFELTYLTANNEVIKVDTVHYKMGESSSSQVFFKANESTTIGQKIPDNTATAVGKIISTNQM